jgi:anion-transporting  ArsA/GET3 family ATPase
MAETFRFGPMAEQSQSILKTIHNSDLTQIHIVTLPEELPFQETCEMIKDLPKVTSIKPQVWLNKLICYPELSAALGASELASDFQELEKLQEFYATELNRLAPGLKKIPFFYDLNPLTLSQKIAGEISS